MKKIKIAGVLLFVFSSLQADIYDDYKLIVNGVLVNNKKIKKLEEENVQLRKEVEALKKVSYKATGISYDDFLDNQTRSKLKEISNSKQ